MKKNFIWLFGNINHFIRKSFKDNISAIAGQTTFFIILSFVPFVMFAFALLSYFHVPTQLLEHYYVDVLPREVMEYIRNIVNDAYPKAVSMAFTSAIIALWSAGRGIHCITQGVFIIYKSPDKKNWFIKRLQASLYTLIMFVTLVISLIVLVISQFFSKFIENFLSTLPYALDVLYAFRYVIMFVVLIVLMTVGLKLLLYSRIRDKKYAKMKCILPGVCITSLGWVILSALISLYVNYFGGFTIYGSLGTAVIVMVWLYFAIMIFLCSMEFNYIYRRKIYDFKFRDLLKKKNDSNLS